MKRMVAGILVMLTLLGMTGCAPLLERTYVTAEINAGGIQFIIKIDDCFLLCLRKLVFHRSASFALAAFTGVSF